MQMRLRNQNHHFIFSTVNPISELLYRELPVNLFKFLLCYLILILLSLLLIMRIDLVIIFQ